jgi:ABC-type transport system involved in cytochrome c biogenesis permease subunit
MALTMLTILVSLLLFAADWWRRDEKARKWAWSLFRTAVVLQAVVIGAAFYQLGRVDNIASGIPQRQYAALGQWLADQNQMKLPPGAETQVASEWIQERAADFSATAKSNPIELGGLIGLFVALLLVALFGWRRREIDKTLPSLQTIDGLLYRTVGVAFPLLSLLLITGAVWANESWGRYWGWDSKEVGALVAWMAYAGFLHTRISHGWRGRRSAYFALLGFALVIFTWLGVSYLLPGLHSYA